MELLLGEDDLDCVNLPVYTEAFIKDRYAAVCFGMIIVVTFVLKDSHIAEDCETMGEASWNKELMMIVFCQFHGCMFAICRRAFANVNSYIKDFPFDTTYKLGLSEWRFLKVETSHYSFG